VNGWRKLLGAALACALAFAAAPGMAEEPAGEPTPESLAASDGAASAAAADAPAEPAEPEGDTESQGEAAPDEEAEPEPESRLHRSLDRASDFAPAGVILDHTHRKGDWTFLYRYMREDKDGLLSGTDSPQPWEITKYSSVPRSSATNTHMFGVMYAPLDRLTFALMLPWQQKEIDVIGPSTAGSGETSGIGDAKLMFLLPFVQKGKELTQFNFGISFPTGSIMEVDPSGQRLPYALQLGSGSWDIYWGITYTGQYRFVSWGSQFEGLYRLNDNDIGYRLGTDYTASIWLAFSMGKWVSASGRMVWTRLGNIKGADPALDKTLNPLNDNMKRGATLLELGPGVNILLPFFGGQRIALEATFPVFQNLDGPQLSKDVTFTAGWQWIF
jgi:hypothetical protein